MAYVLLGVDCKDQEKFERQFNHLQRQVRSGKATKKYNWLAMHSGVFSSRQYGIVGFLCQGLERDERNRMMHHAARQLEESRQTFGTVVLSLDVDRPHYPYDAMMYVPGSARGH